MPEVSLIGTFTWRSCEWYMKALPSGMRCETTARQAMTPLRLTASTQSLSAAPIRSASPGEIQTTGPPRNSSSMRRLSWYSEWIDHLECGLIQRTTTSASPGSRSPWAWRAVESGGR